LKEEGEEGPVILAAASQAIAMHGGNGNGNGR